MPIRSARPAEIRSIAVDLLTLLEREQRAVNDEIAAYPKPIPRCDAQFNFLYEQRGALTEPIMTLRDALQSANSEAIVRACTRIASRGPCTRDEHERGLRESLQDALASVDAVR